MKRIAPMMMLAPLALAACMSPAPDPEAPPPPVSNLRPAAAPFPPDVLRALPPGVSLASLQVDAANCYFYDTGSGPEPIVTTTTTGPQPFCGV